MINVYYFKVYFLIQILICLAACGIPFQVLPDYIEGAEQVNSILYW